MMRLNRQLSVLWSVALLLAPVGPAAADGGDESLIHACVKHNGQVRLVGPNDTCRPRRTTIHWPGVSVGLEILTGAEAVPFEIARGGMTSAIVSFASTFTEPPVVMITSTSVLRDVVVSVGSKTASDFEVVLALSGNSSEPSIDGTYTFDWIAIGH